MIIMAAARAMPHKARRVCACCSLGSCKHSASRLKNTVVIATVESNETSCASRCCTSECLMLAVYLRNSRHWTIHSIQACTYLSVMQTMRRYEPCEKLLPDGVRDDAATPYCTSAWESSTLRDHHKPYKTVKAVYICTIAKPLDESPCKCTMLCKADCQQTTASMLLLNQSLFPNHSEQ